MFNSVQHHYLTEEIRRVYSTFSSLDIVEHLMRKYNIGRALAWAALREYNLNRQMS